MQVYAPQRLLVKISKLQDIFNGVDAMTKGGGLEEGEPKGKMTENPPITKLNAMSFAFMYNNTSKDALPHLTLLITVSAPNSTFNSAALAFTALNIDLSKSSRERRTVSTHDSWRSQYSPLNAS